jgi:enoyl-CoA hydratase/carnithine racemase
LNPQLPWQLAKETARNAFLHGVKIMQFVNTNIKDHVATVVLNAPPVNAVSFELMKELISTFDRLGEMDEVRVAVLTAAGKVFSAGVDIKARVGAVYEPGDKMANARLAREMSYCMIECKKPIIAAVNGPALGAGLGLAASCDILVCSEDASFGLPEIDVGLMGGGKHAMRLFGHSLTRRMMLTGYRVPAAELYRLGIVEAALPSGELMPYALDMAAVIASKSPIASRTAKHSASTIEFMGLRDGYRFEQMLTSELGLTEDSKESMRAFVEKRKPIFTGR